LQKMNIKEKKIIYFDGICLLCSVLVNFIMLHDKNNIFLFSALQSDFAKKNLPNQNLDTVYYQNNSKIYQKSEAILKILFDLGGIWKIFIVFLILPKFLRDFFYDVVANFRYRVWGKQLECRLPSESEKSKFIY